MFLSVSVPSPTQPGRRTNLKENGSLLRVGPRFISKLYVERYRNPPRKKETLAALNEIAECKGGTSILGEVSKTLWRYKGVSMVR